MLKTFSLKHVVRVAHVKAKKLQKLHKGWTHTALWVLFKRSLSYQLETSTASSCFHRLLSMIQQRESVIHIALLTVGFRSTWNQLLKYQSPDNSNESFRQCSFTVILIFVCRSNVLWKFLQTWRRIKQAGHGSIQMKSVVYENINGVAGTWTAAYENMRSLLRHCDDNSSFTETKTPNTVNVKPQSRAFCIFCSCHMTSTIAYI